LAADFATGSVSRLGMLSVTSFWRPFPEDGAAGEPAATSARSSAGATLLRNDQSTARITTSTYDSTKSLLCGRTCHGDRERRRQGYPRAVSRVQEQRPPLRIPPKRHAIKTKNAGSTACQVGRLGTPHKPCRSDAPLRLYAAAQITRSLFCHLGSRTGHKPWPAWGVLVGKGRASRQRGGGRGGGGGLHGGGGGGGPWFELPSTAWPPPSGQGRKARRDQGYSGEMHRRAACVGSVSSAGSEGRTQPPPPPPPGAEHGGGRRPGARNQPAAPGAPPARTRGSSRFGSTTSVEAKRRRWAQGSARLAAGHAVGPPTAHILFMNNCARLFHKRGFGRYFDTTDPGAVPPGSMAGRGAYGPEPSPAGDVNKPVPPPNGE